VEGHYSVSGNVLFLNYILIVWKSIEIKFTKEDNNNKLFFENSNDIVTKADCAEE